MKVPAVALVGGILLGAALLLVVETASDDGPSSEQADALAVADGSSVNSDGPGTAALPSRTAVVVATPPGAVESKPADLLVPITEDSPRSRFTLVGFEAGLRNGSETIPLKESAGEFDQVTILAKVPVDLKVRVPRTEAGKVVRIDAPDGGLIERADGPLEFVADGSALDLDLTFTPTLGSGSYLVAVRHAGDTRSLSFWVGPRAPVGERGPDFVPLPPETASN